MITMFASAILDSCCWFREWIDGDFAEVGTYIYIYMLFCAPCLKRM
jgi:hypothetical protein